MNPFVIDVNVLFSAFISGKNLYKNLFIHNKFYTPDFALLEIEKYKKTILKKTKLEQEILKEFSLIIFSKLTIVPNFLIKKESIVKAYDLCKDIDEKDTMYIALSIELQIPVITRDKKLYEKLKEKGYKDIILFDDFLNNFL